MKKALSCIIVLPMLLVAAEWQSLNGPPAGRADDMSMGLYESEWVIYAADQTHKLYKSTNEGEYWDSLPPPEYPNPLIVQPHGVVTNPTNSQIVYICKWVNWGENAIWKSQNGGRTWLYKDDVNMTNKHLDCIAIDPNYPDTIYVGGDAWAYGGFFHAAVFRSENGGDDWIAMKILPSNTTDPWIKDISVVSDESNSIVLAATDYGSNMDGIYRSVNGGSWVNVETNAMLSVDFASLDVAYAGRKSEEDFCIYKSTDGGANWYGLSNSPWQRGVTDIEAVTELCVWAATGEGMIVTYDGGTTWYERNTNLLCENCLHAMVHPANSNIIFAGTDWSIYKAADGGYLWFDINNGFPIAKVSNIATNDPDIYCIGPVYPSRSSIYRGKQWGSIWQTLRGIFEAVLTPSVIVCKSDEDNIIWFGGNSSTPEQYKEGYIYLSDDYGVEWIEVYHLNHPGNAGDNCINAIEYCPQLTDIVFAGYDGAQGHPESCKKSRDGGYNWSDRTLPGNPPVYCFSTDRQGSGVVYAGTQYHGVYKSSDCGEEWFSTTFNDKTINALVVDDDCPNIYYAGSVNPYGIYKTVDGFSSYPPPVDNGLDYLYVSDLEIDYEEPTIVYALCKANGLASATYVYCTVDRGGKWFNVTTGLPEENVNDLEIDSDVPDPVYAATENGIFIYTPDFNKHLVSSSDQATFANNGRNMMRIEGTDEIWVTYESGGVIYVTYTTNAGFSWSKKMELGQGSYPAISSNPVIAPPVPGVVWHYLDDENHHYIYFARYLGNNQWSAPVEIVSGMNLIGPPSFAIDDDNCGHLAYCEASNIKYLTFDIFDPLVSLPAWVGAGYYPSIGFMVSATNPNIHITWEYDDQIWYRYPPFGLGSPSRVSGSNTTCHHPSLVVEGNVVYFAWEADGDISWCWITHNYPFTQWGSIKQVCSTNEIPSAYPVLTSGYYCSWVEEQSGSYEVYASDYDPEETSWNTPQNISTGADETFSNYPHIVHKQTLLGTTVYFIWTEGNENLPQPTAPPYEIVFKTHAFGGMEEGGGDALPMYIAECGEEEPSPFTLRREGYVHYGAEPFKRIDFDAKYLEYEFTHLDSSKIYKVQAYLYQRGSSNLPITLDIDGHQFTTLNIPPDTLIIKEHVVPDLLYKDGQITLKIFGDKAVSGLLMLSEFEHDRKGGGPQGTEGLSGMPDCFSLSAYPCPASNAFVMEYAVPIAGVVYVTLYDAAGRCVQEISNAYMQPGMYQKQVDLVGIAQGVYFLRLESNNEVIIRKTVVLR